MCGTMEHLSVSACPNDLNLLDDSVNTAVLYERTQPLFCFDCKETGMEKEAEKLGRY